MIGGAIEVIKRGEAHCRELAPKEVQLLFRKDDLVRLLHAGKASILRLFFARFDIRGVKFLTCNMPDMARFKKVAR